MSITASLNQIQHISTSLSRHHITLDSTEAFFNTISQFNIPPQLYKNMTVFQNTIPHPTAPQHTKLQRPPQDASSVYMYPRQRKFSQVAMALASQVKCKSQSLQRRLLLQSSLHQPAFSDGSVLLYYFHPSSQVSNPTSLIPVLHPLYFVTDMESGFTIKTSSPAPSSSSKTDSASHPSPDPNSRPPSAPYDPQTSSPPSGFPHHSPQHHSH
jgi:hypothetical protein